MIGHMSLVRFYNKHVGVMVLDNNEWSLVSDVRDGKDDIGHKYGFKHSWWCGGDITNIVRLWEVKEINSPAIDAMNQTIQIWLELAENGETVDWKKEIYKQYPHGCPLCQYVVDGSGSCEECPMYGHWGSSRNNTCDTPGASYYAWRNETDPNERKAKARAIVNEMIKVRAGMIASLEEKKEETMDIVELNIEKKVTNKLRFKLDNDCGGVRLIAVDEKGERLLDGTILRIKQNGTLWLASSIRGDLGLQLDGDGRIVIE